MRIIRGVSLATYNATVVIMYANYCPLDTLGLHRVENPDHSNVAVSLHLYCPPFDACSVFNKNTGKQTKCKVTFWSVNGQKVREPNAPEDN